MSIKQTGRPLFLGLCLILASATLWPVTFAQEVDGAGKAPAPGSAQRGSGVIPLLARSDVRADLELLDEQREAINKLNAALPKRLLDLTLGSRGLSADERRQRTNEFDRQLGADLAGILLPDQLKRLNQIEFQLRVQRASISEEIINDNVIKALEVSSDQLRQWNSIRQQVDREYDRQRTAIREQAEAQFLAKLTPDQRVRWNELCGPPFLVKENATSQRGAVANKQPRP